MSGNWDDNERSIFLLWTWPKFFCLRFLLTLKGLNWSVIIWESNFLMNFIPLNVKNEILYAILMTNLKHSNFDEHTWMIKLWLQLILKYWNKFNSVWVFDLYWFIDPIDWVKVGIEMDQTNLMLIQLIK